MTKTMTPKELAVELEADAKLTRSYLRSPHSTVASLAPGKGGRWAIPATAKDIKGHKARFAKFEAARAAEAAARNAAKGTEGEGDDTPTPETEGDDA